MFLLYHALVREDGGDPVLGLSGEEYAGPVHSCARGMKRLESLTRLRPASPY